MLPTRSGRGPVVTRYRYQLDVQSVSSRPTRGGMSGGGRRGSKGPGCGRARREGNLACPAQLTLQSAGAGGANSWRANSAEVRPTGFRREAASCPKRRVSQPLLSADGSSTPALPDRRGRRVPAGDPRLIAAVPSPDRGSSRFVHQAGRRKTTGVSVSGPSNGKQPLRG